MMSFIYCDEGEYWHRNGQPQIFQGRGSNYVSNEQQVRDVRWLSSVCFIYADERISVEYIIECFTHTVKIFLLIHAFLRFSWHYVGSGLCAWKCASPRVMVKAIRNRLRCQAWCRFYNAIRKEKYEGNRWENYMFPYHKSERCCKRLSNQRIAWHLHGVFFPLPAQALGDSCLIISQCAAKVSRLLLCMTKRKAWKRRRSLP